VDITGIREFANSLDPVMWEKFWSLIFTPLSSPLKFKTMAGQKGLLRIEGSAGEYSFCK